MLIRKNTILWLAAAVALAACTSAPKYERISAKYLSCDPKEMKPVEITNHGWYKSWYVNCAGQEYFCRYSESNENDWNGCRLTKTIPTN